MQQQIIIPRKWFLVMIGFASLNEKANQLSHFQFLELKGIIDNYLSRIYREFRKKGAIVGSLVWSEENLAPLFLLEQTSNNERFLKEQKHLIDNITEEIFASLTTEEQNSPLGKNLQELTLEGKILLLDCKIPFDPELFPENHLVLSIFSDLFNSELRTIKRSEHDFQGREEWLATIEAILTRDLTKEVGPIKKLREIKSIMSKRKYKSKNPGDFEKIVRILSDIIPFRTSLLDIEKPSSSIENRSVLGHIIIQYLSTEGDFPIKLMNRSTTFDRLGRKMENYNWIQKNAIDWQKLDKLIFHTKEIVYDKFEKVLLDVGAVKLDNFWSETNLTNNAYFLSQFDFTEDILKKLKKTLANPRKLLEEQIGPGTSSYYDLWEKAGLHLNLLVFEVRGVDESEDKKLSDWVKLLKSRVIPGPCYGFDSQSLKERSYRPY